MPLLVAKDNMEYSMIGYNVIEEVIKSPDQWGGESADSLGELMSSAFSEVKQESVTALVDLLQSAGIERDIILGCHTPLGNLHLVQSVTPLGVQRKDLPLPESRNSTEEDNFVSPECESQPVSREQGVEPRSEETSSSIRTPQVELGNLTEDQQQLAITMLQEEADSFAKDDEDVGCIKGLQMNLTLSEPTPVQKTYTSLPHPFYIEVKHYIEDLLIQGWIAKSQSSYASPVVCVRKKEGGLHLCIDYRELNCKTVPVCHPIPQIQDTLDNLGGRSWFSLSIFKCSFMRVQMCREVSPT